MTPKTITRKALRKGSELSMNMYGIHTQFMSLIALILLWVHRRTHRAWLLSGGTHNSPHTKEFAPMFIDA
ncbi:MAG: hypothetical protein QW191_05470, partial [Conexivisphaerales archaeon]